MSLALLLPAVSGAWQAAPARVGAPEAGAAPAAAPAAAAQTRQARAQQARQDEDIERAARAVLSMVDRGQLAEVWDGASPMVKRLVSRAEFEMQVQADRRRLGRVVFRGEPVVNRERYPAGGRVPQGEYLNVATATRFANADAPVRELVSFRLDEDRVWRVSGYSVR